MSVFDAEAILSELKSFQRDAVDHVIDRFYESADASRRFLVADETGLGKSVVARGVIARVIDQLENDDTVDRIDVVYICSNADLAQQNLQRLNVTGNPHLAFTSRLSLLALESRRLSGTAIDGKVVNLVSFTPGTSFNNGSWRTGSKEERALLHVILNDELLHNSAETHASRLLFQGTVRTQSSFSECVDWIRRVLDGAVHEPILTAFRSSAVELGLLTRYQHLVGEIVQDGLPENMDAIRALTAELRGALARASVETLEPDLVILDEFQRFSHLLDPETGGEAAELAHHLFDYGQAKVLLLSATPYKAYTAAKDSSDEDHYTDFIAILGFLAGGPTADLSEVKRLFGAYGDGIAAGAPVDDILAALRERLLRWMSRTERPQLGDDGMLRERVITSSAPTPADLIGFAGLKRLAEELGAPISIEYWKSIPYFGNFMESYQASRALDRRLDEVDSAEAIQPLSRRSTRKRCDPMRRSDSRMGISAPLPMTCWGRACGNSSGYPRRCPTLNRPEPSEMPVSPQRQSALSSHRGRRHQPRLPAYSATRQSGSQRSGRRGCLVTRLRHARIWLPVSTGRWWMAKRTRCRRWHSSGHTPPWQLEPIP